MLNYNHLYYFYVTAQLESVTRAAARLNIQQPSLSSQIKTLEGQLGRALFQKVGRQIRLTHQGEIIFRYCERMFEASSDLEHYLKGREQTIGQKLRIGVTEQIDQTFVADLLSHMAGFKKIKDSALRVVSGDSVELADLLKTQKIDLLISNSSSYGPDIQPFIDLDMSMGLFISKGLFQKNRLGLLNTKAWLKQKNVGLVLPSEKLKLRHEIDSYLQKYKVQTSITFESDIISVVARAIVDGIGIGFMPKPYLVEEMKLGLVVDLNQSQSLWSHKLYMMLQPAQKLDPILIEMKSQLLNFQSLQKGLL